MASLRAFRPNDVPVDSHDTMGHVMISRCVKLALVLLFVCSLVSAMPQKPVWKSVEFAIVKFNDEAPKSWNIYHTERKGLLLVHLWKRYLLVDMKEQEAYEIDPQTVKLRGEGVEWSTADKPDKPSGPPAWKPPVAAAGQLESFRSAKGGNAL